MTVSKAPTETKIEQGRRINKLWELWFSKLTKEVNAARGEEPLILPSYTVATVPDEATYINTMIYISDESGGAVPAFSDGTNWRRVTDRAIIS